MPQPGGPDEHDVALFDLDVVAEPLGADALEVIVDGDAEDLFGALLPDDVFAELGIDLLGSEVADGRRGLRLRGRGSLFVDNALAEAHTFVADVNFAGTGDESLDLVLLLSAEGALVLRP